MAHTATPPPTHPLKGSSALETPLVLRVYIGLLFCPLFHKKLRFLIMMMMTHQHHHN